MPEPRTNPVTVTSRASGVDLDVHPYARDLLRGLIGLLAEFPDVWDDLDDIINGPVITHDPHLPDVPARDDVLVEQFLTVLPTSIRVYGPETARLAAQLTAITERQAGQPGRSAA